MLRWETKVNKFIPYVGRYGDSVNFESLNTEVQTYELAKMPMLFQVMGQMDMNRAVLQEK